MNSTTQRSDYPAVMSAVDRLTASDGAEGRSVVRSCTTCAKAKAKCTRQLGRSTCERCARLNKECHTREATLRKRKHVKLTRSEQLEKLESKIESLVSAFSSQNAAERLSPPDSQAASEPPPDRFAHVRPTASDRRPDNSQPHRGEFLWEKICRYEEDAARAQAQAQNTGFGVGEDPVKKFEGNVLNSTGEIYLDRYRRLMADGCPFVKIPEEASFVRVYQQRPMLMSAIAVVASFHDLAKQHDLAQDFMRIMSERILFRSEKSIDILQALLIFITWNHPHFFWAHQITNLLHLAIAQAVDLSIDRWPHAFDKHKFENAAHKAVSGKDNTTQKSTLEERRAVLGIFYMTSMLSATFRKIDAVRWSSWHEECLKILDVAQEYESDRVLVAMIKLQTLVDDLGPIGTSAAPIHAYIKVYQRDVERLRASTPQCETNIHLRMQYVATQIYLWELSYADLFEAKKSSRMLQRHHLEGIYQCIDAVKSNLGFFASIPRSTYLTLPFQTFVTFAQAFMAMLRLATLEVDGWDLREFRETMNIAELIEQGARSYEEASHAIIDGMPVNNDCFTKWAGKLRWAGQMYETKFGTEDSNSTDKDAATTQSSMPSNAAPTPVSAQSNAAGPQLVPNEDFGNGNILGYLDDVFWNNFSADIDFGTDFNMPAL